MNITTDNVLPAATARNCWIPVWSVRQTPAGLSAPLGTGGDQDFSLLIRLFIFRKHFGHKGSKIEFSC